MLTNQFSFYLVRELVSDSHSGHESRRKVVPGESEGPFRRPDKILGGGFDCRGPDSRVTAFYEGNRDNHNYV